MADKENKRFYWIKLKENFFNIETIDWLISQKNGCEYIVLYQKLCLLTANKNGELSMQIGEMIIPFDADKIARDTKFKIDTVLVAMELFKKIGLIYEQEDGILKIPYVEEIVGSETASAERVRKHRAAKKALQSNNNVTQEIENREREKIIDIKTSDVKSLEVQRVDYEHIKDMYNDICISFPRLTVLSDKRKQTIKARLKTYSVEQIKELFQKAEASDFLKGSNDRDWQANFDWLMKDSNIAKVLDGNYDNKTSKPKQSRQSSGNPFLDLAKEENLFFTGE